MQTFSRAAPSVTAYAAPPSSERKAEICTNRYQTTKKPEGICLRAFLVSLRGVEPPACRLGGGRSIQLSYRDIHIYRVNAIYSIYDCRPNCKQMPPSAFGLFRICLQEGIALRRKKHYDNEMNQTAAVWSLCTSEEAPRCSQKKSKA